MGFCLFGKIFLINSFISGCAGSSLLRTGCSLVAESRGYSLVLVGGLLIALASLVVEYRL